MNIKTLGCLQICLAIAFICQTGLSQVTLQNVSKRDLFLVQEIREQLDLSEEQEDTAGHLLSSHAKLRKSLPMKLQEFQIENQRLRQQNLVEFQSKQSEMMKAFRAELKELDDQFDEILLDHQRELFMRIQYQLLNVQALMLPEFQTLLKLSKNQSEDINAAINQFWVDRKKIGREQGSDNMKESKVQELDLAKGLRKRILKMLSNSQSKKLATLKPVDLQTRILNPYIFPIQ